MNNVTEIHIRTRFNMQVSTGRKLLDTVLDIPQCCNLKIQTEMTNTYKKSGVKLLLLNIYKFQLNARLLLLLLLLLLLPFYGPLNPVQDYPGEPVPER